LLEKYQFVEPRHDLIAKALWLLADPTGFENKIREQGGKAATEKVVRQLKTEQSRKIASSINNQYDDEPRRNTTSRSEPRKLSKTSMFKRF